MHRPYRAAFPDDRDLWALLLRPSGLEDFIQRKYQSITAVLNKVPFGAVTSVPYIILAWERGTLVTVQVTILPLTSIALMALPRFILSRRERCSIL
jgi:hypothetical protein